MSNIIDSIQISGVTYTISGQSSGANAVEVTQAEYDALVTGGTVDPNAFYIITDATPADMSQYWTSAQTQSAINQSVSGKQDTLVSSVNIKTINNTSILGSGNIDIQGGGGKTIEAGRGISVTTGETADTVSFNLPISANTNNSIVMGGKITNSFTNNGRDCLMVGSDDTISNGSDCCLVVGYRSSVNGDGSAVIGWNSKSVGDSSFAFGTNVSATTSNSFAIGYFTITNNDYEHTSGKYNVSNTGSTTADKTLFSVGNGTADNARHNAFEIRQNGDIYLSSGGTDIKLQDHLGGGGGSITIDSGITSGSTNAVENGAIWSATTYNKEVTLEFDNSVVGQMKPSTNFPSGCTTVKVTIPNGIGYITVYFYSGSTNIQVGSATINNYGTPSVSMNFTDASYTIVDGVVIITYPASKSVNKVGVGNNLEGAIVKAVVEGAWVNENTYMSAEVDGKIKALDNKKLDATAYTPVVVDSQLNAASTNPVQNQALYDELVIEGGEVETTLTFSADTTYIMYKSTNYPNGCTKVKVVYPTNSSGAIYFNNGNNQLGSASFSNYGTPSVQLSFNGASYTIVDGVVVITYPTVANVDNIRYSMYGTAPDSVKAVYTQTTHLIDQVTANTTALGGLSLVKLTESEYTALVTKDSNTLYVVIPDPSN